MLKRFVKLSISNDVIKKRFVQAASKQYLNFEEEWKKAKPFESIPSIGKLSLILANLPGGKYYKLSLMDIQRKMRQEYGDIFFVPGLFGKESLVMTFNPNDFEKVFRNEGVWPHRRSLDALQYYRKTVRPDIYSEYGGLFNEQKEAWQKMRSITNPVMMQPRTAKLYISSVDEIAKDFLKIVDQIRDGNCEVPADFGDYINRWSLESIAFIALDRRLGLLSDNIDENAQALIKGIRIFFEMGFQFEILPSIWKYYHTKQFKVYMKNFDDMTNIIVGYIEDAIRRFDHKTVKDDHELSVLEKLLKINKNVAVIMTADMILAGVDTTASAVIGILYCLAKNPDKQEKLREELTKAIPEEDSPLTSEILEHLPYLRAVIKEGLRLYSPTSGNLRKSVNDIVLQGYRIPKGLDILMGITQLQLDSNHYPDSTKYLPERWLREEENRNSCPFAKDAHPFSYLPFGFGKRMCIGKRFAEMEIEVFISRIIRHYKVEWHHPDMKIKSVLVNIPDGPLKFRLLNI